MTIEDIDNSESTELTVDDMLNSGDPVLIEMAKELSGQTVSEEPAKQQESSEPKGSDESAEKNDATQSGEDETQAPAQTTQPITEQPRIDGVLTKDGKHVLPFAELENARSQAKQFKEQLDAQQQEMDSLRSDREKIQRQLQLAQEKGVELPKLPEDELITDEMVSELEDVSPELAVLARKVKYFQEREASQAQAMQKTEQQAANAQRVQEAAEQQGAAPDDTVVKQAIQANQALVEIIKNPDMFKYAQEVEARLSNDPAFESLDKRYAEVVKRVGGVYGIDFAEKYGPQVVGAPASKQPSKKPAPNLQEDLPHSLSELQSTSETASKTTQEVLADMSPERLNESLEKMSNKDIEALLY